MNYNADIMKMGEKKAVFKDTEKSRANHSM